MISMAKLIHDIEDLQRVLRDATRMRHQPKRFRDGLRLRVSALEGLRVNRDEAGEYWMVNSYDGHDAFLVTIPSKVVADQFKHALAEGLGSLRELLQATDTEDFPGEYASGASPSRSRVFKTCYPLRGINHMADRVATGLDHPPRDSAEEEPRNSAGGGVPDIIEDINEGQVSSEMLVTSEGWRTIRRARALYARLVDAEAWKELCTRRRYLYPRQNSRGF